MRYKSLCKRILCVMLSLIMAIPVIALAPVTVVADDAEQFTVFEFENMDFIPIEPMSAIPGFAVGRDTITVNGITATVIPASVNADGSSLMFWFPEISTME